MTVVMNGLREREVRSWTRRPRKQDNGHSAVFFETWWIRNFTWRKAVTCQCGRRFTGYGDRSYYSYNAHVRNMEASREQAG